MSFSVLRMLLRPAPGDRGTLLIPAVAFASVSALMLIVIGGAQVFWTWNDDYAMIYRTLAAVALALLLVPLGTLGGAAARLSARRRDERLSTLRLLGVTPGGVGFLAVVESTFVAAIGVVAGALLSLAAAPAIGLIRFRGEALGTAAVLLSPAMFLGVLLAIIVLAAVSAIIGLRRVVISPLGVRTRQSATNVHWVRAVIAVTVVGAAFVIAKAVPAVAGAVTLSVILAGLFAGVLAVLNLVGPWVLKVMANRQARRASTPERLLSARLVLDNPQASWRQVGGIAMASFMAVFAGTGVALIDAMGAEGASVDDIALATDMRTGLIITLVASFLMVAASVGVTQASEMLDQRALHRSLHFLGMPASTVVAARRRSVMSPLLVTALGSALCAVIVVLPLLGIALIIAPLSILTIALVMATGVALVWAGTLATKPLLTSAFAG